MKFRAMVWNQGISLLITIPYIDARIMHLKAGDIVEVDVSKAPKADKVKA